MKRKIAAVLVLVLVLTLSLSTVVNADSSPAGSCPSGFTIMSVMTHDQMEHTHVGLKTDLNGDGYLCMREATSSIHVHMDDALPLP